MNIPIKIINAENSFLLDGGKRYFDRANKPKERVIITGAGHTFDEDGIEERLFEETLKWIKYHSRKGRYGEN